MIRERSAWPRIALSKPGKNRAGTGVSAAGDRDRLPRNQHLPRQQRPIQVSFRQRPQRRHAPPQQSIASKPARSRQPRRPAKPWLRPVETDRPILRSRPPWGNLNLVFQLHRSFPIRRRPNRRRRRRPSSRRPMPKTARSNPSARKGARGVRRSGRTGPSQPSDQGVRRSARSKPNRRTNATSSGNRH